jgi:HK97 family phage major capsid protein
VAYNNLISRTDVAALIPEEVSSKVLEGVVGQSAALSVFPRVTMSRAQQRLPVLSALPTAYFVNGDTGLKQTTEQNWANKYLNAEEVAAIVPIPEAVLDDSDFDAWGSVQPRLEESIGRVLDAAVFFGTNKPASWPTDIVSAAVAAGNTVNRGTNAAAAGGIIGDFSDVYGTVETDGYDPNALVAVRTIKARLRQVRATTGETLGDEDFAREIKQNVTFPMRGLWATASGSAEAIAFDRSEFMLAVRQDMTYKVLDQAVIQDNTGAIVYNLAQQDMVALRVVARFGWQVANIINYDQATEANRYPAGVLRVP